MARPKNFKKTFLSDEFFEKFKELLINEKKITYEEIYEILRPQLPDYKFSFNTFISSIIYKFWFG